MRGMRLNLYFGDLGGPRLITLYSLRDSEAASRRKGAVYRTRYNIQPVHHQYTNARAHTQANKTPTRKTARKTAHYGNYKICISTGNIVLFIYSAGACGIPGRVWNTDIISCNSSSSPCFVLADHHKCSNMSILCCCKNTTRFACYIF